MKNKSCDKENCEELNSVKVGLFKVINSKTDRTPTQQKHIDDFVKNTLAYIGHPDEEL